MKQDLMMTIDRVIELMQIERECIRRGNSCGRDCVRCDLVQNDDELIAAYDKALNILLYERLKEAIKQHRIDAAREKKYGGRP